MSVDVTCAKNQTAAWLQSFVVDLNLCPFARPVVNRGLRVEVCAAPDRDDVARAFLAELELINSASEQEVATTLLVMPNALSDFDDYLDFVELCNELLVEAGLEGIIQLASFHPDYCFQGEEVDSASHYSNRSPYPTLHLIREEMLARAVDSYPNPQQIPQRNIALLESMGVEKIRQRMAAALADSTE